MSYSIRRFALSAGLAVLPALGVGLAPAIAGNSTVCAAAATGAPHAALVVDTGSGVATYCVALGAPSITGIQLVEQAGRQSGMTYRLGFGGQAVCMLNGVGGPSGDDCLTGQSSYWGFWVGDGSGGWTWSSAGAGSVSVHDGDVQGWAWGVGIDGATHPQPPATRLTDVCKAPSPSPSPSPAGGHGGNGNGSGSGGSGGSGGGNPSSSVPRPAVTPSESASPSPARASHHRSAPPRVHPSRSGAPPVASPTQVVAAAGPPPGPRPGSGSPVGIFLALGFTGVLGAGGWLRVRSGRSKEAP